MITNQYNAYAIEDFPIKGGIFHSPIEEEKLNIAKLGLKKNSGVEIICDNLRLGRKKIAKGSRIISRMRYQVKNISQNIQGEAEVLCLETSRRETQYFVISHMPLSNGDEVEIAFLDLSCRPVGQQLN